MKRESLYREKIEGQNSRTLNNATKQYNWKYITNTSE